MKLFIAVVLCISVAADRLENTYLPPSSAQTAGGDGNVLNAPVGLSDPSGEYKDSHPNGGHPDAAAATLRFENENVGDGSYKFEFETENRISQQEIGELRDFGGDEGGVTVVHGSYAYMAPNGVMYNVEYVADENGFQPIGEHIPTAHPVPEAIQRSLENNQFENLNGYSSENKRYPTNTGSEIDQNHHITGASKSGFGFSHQQPQNQKHGLITSSEHQRQEFPSNTGSNQQDVISDSGINHQRVAVKSGSGFDTNQQVVANQNQGYPSNTGSRSHGLISESEQNRQAAIATKSGFGFDNHQRSSVSDHGVNEHGQNSNGAIVSKSGSHQKGYASNQQGKNQYGINLNQEYSRPNTPPQTEQAHQGYPINSVSNISRGLLHQQSINQKHTSNIKNEQGTPIYSTSNIPHGFTPQLHNQGHINAPKDQIHQGYAINTSPNSLQQSRHEVINQGHIIAPKEQTHQGYPANSGPNSPHGFAPQQSLQEGINHGNINAAKEQINAGYPANSGSNISNGFSLQQPHQKGHINTPKEGYPANSRSKTPHGYPKTDSKNPLQNQHGYPSHSASNPQGQHASQGYPGNHGPPHVSQGFAPQQDHADNIDSSHNHQHDHSGEEDAVVVEAAGRSFQPPQVPSGRIAPGQQAFDEQTGYQY